MMNLPSNSDRCSAVLPVVSMLRDGAKPHAPRDFEISKLEEFEVRNIQVKSGSGVAPFKGVAGDAQRLPIAGCRSYQSNRLARIRSPSNMSVAQLDRNGTLSRLPQRRPFESQSQSSIGALQRRFGERVIV
jgi:hypothetical protein